MSPAKSTAPVPSSTAGTNSLLRGAAVYLMANLINAAIPFALLPVLTRHLTTLEYGQVAMYQVLLAALGGLLGLSVHGAAGVKYYDDDITHVELGAFIGACFQILLVSTAVVMVFAMLFRGSLSAWLGLRPVWILWGVLASAAGFIQQIRLSQWQVRGHAVRYALFQILASMANAGLSLWLVVGLAQGAEGRIDAQNWVLVFFAAIALALLWRDRLIALNWRPNHLREALRFGIPLLPHVFGLFLLGMVDRIVINEQLGLAKAGVYMVAVQLTLAMPIVFSAINNAYVPWLYERLKRNDYDEKLQIVRLTYLYFFLALAVTVVVFLLGPWAVTLIAGERYAEAGKVVGWLALGQALAGMYLMVTNYIFFSKRTGLLSLVTISSGLLNLALMTALIDQLGIKGAAIAFAIAMAVRFVLTWWVAHRRHPMPWAQPRFFARSSRPPY